MKVWALAGLAILAGIGAALRDTWAEFYAIPYQFEPHNVPAVKLADELLREPDKLGPKLVVVGGTEFNFGTGQRSSKMRHTFVIRNEGDETLILRQGPTSCKCTLSDLDQAHIEPGESMEVQLEWHLTTPGRNFRQTAEIDTNDTIRNRVVLSIVGEVTDMVGLVPGDLVLANVPVNEGTTADFKIFGYRCDSVRVDSYEFVNEAIAEFFDLEFAPLADEEISREKASCGLLARLIVKPGLPLGPINQTLRLQANVDAKGDEPALEMPIGGNVVSDISVIGPSSFVESLNLLKLGTVDSEAGAKATLRILAKGPHRHDFSLSVASVDPEDVLQVKLSDVKSINQGAVYMQQVDIEIPVGAPKISRLGTQENRFGKIVLETTHPTAKTLPIYVKFSVR